MADHRYSATGANLPAQGAGHAAPAVATLTVVDPDAGSGSAVHIRDQTVLIGRDAECDLALTRPSVSPRHAAIRVRGDGFELADLGSANGTWLNGRRLIGEASIGDGDRIRVAHIELTFTTPAAATATSPDSRPVVPDRPARPTEPLGPSEPRRKGSLAKEVVASDAFSYNSLGLAIIGSLVGLILTTRTGLGEWGGLAGAVLGPVLSSIFTTKRTGERGRVRLGAICALSVLAVVITISGLVLAPEDVKKPIVGENDPSALITDALPVSGSSGGSTGGGTRIIDTGDPPVSPPSSPTLSAVPGAPGSVTLNWTGATAAEGRSITGYAVERTPERIEGPVELTGDATNFPDTVPAGTSDFVVRYEVVATDSAGAASESNSVCLNVPADITLTMTVVPCG